MPTAARSLMLPPGFWNSAFPKILHPERSDKVFRYIYQGLQTGTLNSKTGPTRGVLPTEPVNPSTAFMVKDLARLRRRTGENIYGGSKVQSSTTS